MDLKFVSEAYKPAEKLVFDYFIIRSLLSKLMREQKFPIEIDTMLLQVYKNFQSNADELISLYQKMSNVLPLNDLLDDTADEIASVFSDSELDQPLLDTVRATESLVHFIVDIDSYFLTDAEKYLDSIPGFSWDIKSFREAFNEIRKKGIAYVSNE